ncbi:hypothetical protein D3C80_1768560 [compost metagenome]
MDGLKTALPGKRSSIGMPVIKNIPGSINFYDAAVVITAVIHRFGSRLVCTDMKIAVAYKDSLVLEVPGGMFAGRITQLMHGNRGIDKIIGISSLADGRRFKERMSFKSGSGAVGLTRRDK